MENFKFNTVEEALDDLRNGKIILCTDDPDRENEGDMICAAEFAAELALCCVQLHWFYGFARHSLYHTQIRQREALPLYASRITSRFTA